MSPQRRTALVSVGAAVALMAIKLGTGLASGSLGLVSEALHSGTDLVAALLTFFAIGVAGRPGRPLASVRPRQGGAPGRARRGGRRSLLVSLAVGALAVARLAGWIEIETSTAWWVFAAVGGRDRDRRLAHRRLASCGAAVSRARRSPSNALHFGSDLAGTLAVLAGLVAVRAGWPAGDSVAALFVAFLVVTAAARLIRRNVDVLMDRAPADAVLAARAAIAALDPPVEVRRLRLRQAAGRTFTDVVIGVSPGAAVGQGHAVADRVEAAVHARAARAATSSSTSSRQGPRRRCASGCARRRCRSRAVREIHNLSVIELARRLPRLAPPEAAGRASARRGARDRRAGRAGDRRRRARGRRRADPPRAASRARGRARGGRRPRRDRAHRPRGDRRAAARECASSTPTRGSSSSSRSRSTRPRASPTPTRRPRASRSGSGPRCPAWPR